MNTDKKNKQNRLGFSNHTGRPHYFPGRAGGGSGFDLELVFPWVGQARAGDANQLEQMVGAIRHGQGRMDPRARLGAMADKHGDGAD